MKQRKSTNPTKLTSRKQQEQQEYMPEHLTDPIPLGSDEIMHVTAMPSGKPIGNGCYIAGHYLQ